MSNASTAVSEPTPSPALASTAGQSWTLFQVSVLGLFLELLLIRWLGTEVRIFAYLQNTVLVVCFMGLGLGCLTCRQPFALKDVLWPLFSLVLLLAIPYTRRVLGQINELLNLFGDLLIWTETAALSPLQTVFWASVGLALTYVLLRLIWDMFVPVGRLLGRLLDDHPRPIRAYSINVAGSLLGIWLFLLLSLANQPPLAWFLVLCGMLALFRSPAGAERRRETVLLVALAALGWLAGWSPGALEVHWSPYQKLVLEKIGPGTSKPDVIGDYDVIVNNASYQEMVDLSADHICRAPERFPEELRGLSQYDIPFRLVPRPRSVLVVGSGTGNDVAGAIRHQVPEITAVEIDPVIIDLGRRFHPEHPYDPSHDVRIVNDDARSFFATTTQRFDLILFALLDSHTTTAMTNARLDHYVYTRESLERARELLTENGVIVLSFWAQRPFVGDRMAGVLRTVFGEKPLCFRVEASAYGRGGVMFVAGRQDLVQQQLTSDDRLGKLVASQRLELPYVTPVATDDWPYIYLEDARIPLLYWFLAGLLGVLFLQGVRRAGAGDLFRQWGSTQWHFFFLGAAFLLLEVQNISKAAVVLGNTWQVNAVIISAILALVLLANALAARWPGMPLGPVYALLCASCLGLYFTDIARFGFLPYALKALLVGCLTSLPMLFSGIVFIQSFARAERKDLALGANLFGALIGGLLQSVTFIVGVKALLLIVAGLYVAAFLTRPRAAVAVVAPAI